MQQFMPQLHTWVHSRKASQVGLCKNCLACRTCPMCWWTQSTKWWATCRTQQPSTQPQLPKLKVGCSAAIACSPVLEESLAHFAQQLSWAKSLSLVPDGKPVNMAS